MAITFLDPGGDAGFNSSQTTGGGFWQTVNGLTNIATDFVHGAHVKSIKCPPGGSAATLKSPNSVMADAGTRISFYMYIAALPTTSTSKFLIVSTSGGSFIMTLQMTTGGVLQLFTGVTQLGSNGVTFATGKWYRVCVSYKITSTSAYTINVFVNGVSSISVTNSTTLATSVSSTFTLGNGDTNAALDTRFSDIYVDSATTLKDTGDVWVTAKRPNANGTTTGFTTQIGSGGSGYGTGHTPQVNERPLSVTNGWSMVGAGSAVTEEYTIEAANVGDINISGGSFIGYMGWVYAKSLSAETASIIVGNATSNISLTSSNTMFTAASANTTYPTGGTDIGIITSTTLTTVSLFECGIVIAYIPGDSNFFRLF